MSVKKLAMIVIAGMLLSSCVTPGKSTNTAVTPNKASTVKTVALVALNINNYSSFGTGGMIDPRLIDDKTTKMLTYTEETLGKYWKVKPVSTFIKSKRYYNLSEGRANKKYFTPKVRGKEMPVFSKVNKEVIKGTLSSDTAKKLCKTLKVDAVILVYTEWTLQSGKFVPTTKALSKNCIAMYKKSGDQLFYGRKDVLGTKAIGGAFVRPQINEETISQWVGSYKTGFEYVLKRNMNKVM